MQSIDRFMSLPLMQHIANSTHWRVTNRPVFYSARLNVAVSVAPGFVTDLASVPRLVWALIPRDDKHLVEPAVFHDWLYRTRWAGLNEPVRLSRRQCDRLLSDAMIVCGAPWWQRHVVYWAVRLGGWKAWRRQPMAVVA